MGTFDPPTFPGTQRIVLHVTVRLPDSDARAVVEAATRAPSVLNTQPWRWQIHQAAEGTMLELSADSARVLRVTDPLGRFLVISCGAGLFNARLALRQQALDPLVRLSPDPHDPRKLARVTAGPGNPPAVVDETANLEQAARDIVAGASFDNNIICIDEKTVIAVRSTRGRSGQA